jgi:hypothetical protein
MEAVNVQSSHIAQGIGSFISAAFPPNIVGTFRIAGILVAHQDGTSVCEVAPEDGRRVFTRIETIIEEEDGERLEWELYIEHCAEALRSEEMIRPESITQQLPLIWLSSEREQHLTS